MAKIKQATKKTGRARKEQIVAELIEKFDHSNGIVFADYKGLTHHQLESLKKDLKKLNATIVIAKNSLIKLSLNKSAKYADYKDNEGLNLPTATLFIGGDMVEPLKRVQKAIKDFGLPKIKFGVLEGNLTDEAGVLKIASLPNRETLLIHLVGTLNSPISGLVLTLNANIQKFVMTLDAIARLPRPEPSDGGQAQNKPARTTPAAEPPQTQQPQSPQSPEPPQTPTEPETVSAQTQEEAEPASQGQALESQTANAAKSEVSSQESVVAAAEPDQTTTQVDQPTPATTEASANAEATVDKQKNNESAASN